MSKKKTEAPVVGRPMLFENKLTRSSFTAPTGHMEFLRRLGGERTVSAGIRQAIMRLVSLDPASKKIIHDLEEEGYDMGDLSVK